MAGISRSVRAVATHVAGELRGRNIALWAAGLTFFGVLAWVPSSLLALRGAAVVFGDTLVGDGIRAVGGALPAAHGPGPALDALTRAALGMSWPSAFAALVAASLYGEGLRRCLMQVTGTPVTGLTGWAGRLGFVPLVAASPLVVALPLALAPAVAPYYAAGGWSLVPGVVLSFHIGWIVVSVAIGAAFALTAPTILPVRASLVAGFAVGAVMTGFLHGFVLFLAIPVDWSIPFGGLSTVGGVAALALWLYALHVILILGYRTALSTDHVRLAVRRASREKGAPDVAARSAQA